MKTRIVHTRIWEDDYFAKLSEPAKIVFLYLITNHRINLIGLYELPDRVLVFDTGISADSLESIKAELFPKAVFYEGWVYLPNAERLGGYRGEKNDNAKEREWNSVPEVIKNTITTMKSYRVSCSQDTVSEYSDTPINHKSEIINHKSETINHKSEDSVSDFDEAFKSLAEKLEKPKQGGITHEWQDRAFRWAKELKIDLEGFEDKTLKDRWLKMFKDSESKESIKRALNGLYGALIDHPKFVEMNNDRKVLYIFGSVKRYMSGGGDSK